MPASSRPSSVNGPAAWMACIDFGLKVSDRGAASTSTETIRLIRDREKGEGMEVGGEGSYIPIATPSPMIPALRWAAMRAILMF